MNGDELMDHKNFRDKTTTGLARLDERSQSQSKALDQIGKTVAEIATGDHCVKGRMHDNEIDAGREERKRLWKEIKAKTNGQAKDATPEPEPEPVPVPEKPKTWAGVFWAMMEDPRKRSILYIIGMGFIILKMHNIDPISLVAKLLEAVKLANLTP